MMNTGQPSSTPTAIESTVADAAYAAPHSLMISPNVEDDIEQRSDRSTDSLLSPSSPSFLCCLCSTSITCVDGGNAIHLTVRRTKQQHQPSNDKLMTDTTYSAAIDYEHDFDDSDLVVNVRLPTVVLLLFFSLLSFTFFTDYYSRPISLTLDGKQFRGFTHDATVTRESHPFARLRTQQQRFLLAENSTAFPERNQCSTPKGQFQKETASLESHPSNTVIPSTPSLVLSSTPTGVTSVGLHVPCEWLEQNFGSEQQFAQLTQEISIVRVRDNDVLTTSATPLPLSSFDAKHVPQPSNLGVGSSFVPTETYQVQRLLDAAGIYCRHEVLRDACAVGGMSNQHSSRDSLDEIEILRMHSWFLSLPPVATFETEPRNGTTARTPGSVSFNKLTGAIATLNCRSMVRYGAPFAKDEPASVYVEPNLNDLPNAYAQFVANRCTKEARTAYIEGMVGASEHPKTDNIGVPNPNESDSSGQASSVSHHKMKRVKWIEPLLPLLPPVCSVSSFARPSSARFCLRNSRIIAFGDSTTQELLLQLIDFLETEDGEEPNDLTRMRVDQSDDGNSRSSSSSTDWMPRDAGSDGLPRYFYIEHWSPPDACTDQHSLAYMSRLFSTARFPSPYLAAYNITITMRWNVARDPCLNMKGPDRASDLELFRASYRWLQEACLPPNAIEIANKYRQRPDGTFRSSSEYVTEVNSRFHNMARDGQQNYTEEPPPFGCSFPYLTTEESDELSISEWPLHLDHVVGFDYAIVNMGAHYARAWGNAEVQRHDDGYSYSPAQFRHSLEAHVAMVQALARHIIIRESAWRSDGNFGPSIVLINKIIRDVALEAQTKAFQRDREIAQLAALATRTNSHVDRTLESLRRTVSWLPTFFVTAMIKKEDAEHCSYKNIADREGINGMRTPYCYPIIQNIIQLMCTAK